MSFEVRRFEKATSIIQVEEIKKELVNSKYKSYNAIAYNLKDKSTHSKIIEGNIAVMMACQELNIKSVNGYSGSYPNNYMAYFDSTNVETMKVWLDETGTPIESILYINH
jgi:hypothetical protein